MAIYDAAFAVAMVEDKALKLKTQLCDGSFLKGYTAKKEIDPAATKAAFDALKRQMQILEDNIKCLA